MTKNQKHNRRIWRSAILLLLAALVLLAAAVLHYKPSWRYRLLAGIAVYAESGV
ncbi:MAG: hypothetical protein LUD83_10205 [Clostridiales bacterium]|nr:hypothetical protein [Clostridiales bacterium]